MEGVYGGPVLQLGKMHRKMMAQPSPAYAVLAVHGEADVVVGVPENTIGSLGSFLVEKLQELLHLLETIPGFIQGRFDRVVTPETRSVVLHLGEDGAAGSPGNILRTVGSFLLEKLRELLHLLEGIPGFIQEKLDRILPPETRSAALHQWLVIGLTVVLPVVLSLLFLYYCCKCCCCSRGAARMMKAPGRRGQVIRRATFEADPKGYFTDLRANRELLC